MLPPVVPSNFGNNNCLMVLRCTLRAGIRHWSLHFDLHVRTKEHIDEAGVTIPFPQLHVAVRGALPGAVPDAVS